MTDPPTRPRRRWKRWAVMALVLAVGGGVWMLGGESATVGRARKVRLGQSYAEVEAIMGQSLKSIGFGTSDFIVYYATASEDRVVQFRQGLNTWFRKHFRFQYVHFHEPVEIRFRNDRVDSIRRGNEVVNRFGVVFQEMPR